MYNAFLLSLSVASWLTVCLPFVCFRCFFKFTLFFYGCTVVLAARLFYHCLIGRFCLKLCKFLFNVIIYQLRMLSANFQRRLFCCFFASRLAVSSYTFLRLFSFYKMSLLVDYHVPLSYFRCFYSCFFFQKHLFFIINSWLYSRFNGKIVYHYLIGRFSLILYNF